jgi:hypothetical protein
MGFLKSLFGGGRQTEKVRLAALPDWISERTGSESAHTVEECSSLLSSIGGIVDKLEADVRALDVAGFNDVHPRYDKIVKTAKPSYVKSMRLALKDLKPKGSGIGELEAYDRRLSEALDTIGKASFGDGKFLPFTFQSEMIRIQAGCRRLLDAREELNRILSSKGGTPLAGLRRAHEEYLQLLDRSAAVEADAQRMKAECDAYDGRIAALRGELELISKSQEYAELSETRKRLMEAEAEAGKAEDSINSLLSPLKSGIRKYEKTILDGQKAKLAVQLQEDPVGAFMDCPPGEVQTFLGDFAKAIRAGSISIKDAEKTLRKIDAAAKLTGETRTAYSSQMAGIAGMKERLVSLQAASQEERLVNEMGSLEQALGRKRRESEEAGEKVRALGQDALKAEEGIRRQLMELDVELL